MANYRDIKGFQIRSTSSDPVPYSGSWASGGSLNQSRYSLGGAGTQTAGLVFGGYSAPSRRSETEEYNGSSWTEIADVNSARRGVRGFGTYTSGIIAGGYPYVAVVESWNGSAWTEVGDLNVAKAGMGSSGSSNTAGIIFGGNSPTRLATTESWDGSSWTEVND